MSEIWVSGRIRRKLRAEVVMEPEELPFSEGNVTMPVRVGDTVRRATGPHTPAVHAFLRHLESEGFAGAPRVLGRDQRGREILSFLAGETLPRPAEQPPPDGALVVTAQLLRRIHDASTNFVAPADASWWHMPGAPGGGEIICHNDIAPWNTVAKDGLPVGFIDFDFSEPGNREWDIAYAVWTFAPLYHPVPAGEVEDRMRRVRLFFAAYDAPIPLNFLDLLERRILSAYELKRIEAAKGQPGFAKMWAADRGQNILADLAWVHREHETLRRLLFH